MVLRATFLCLSLHWLACIARCHPHKTTTASCFFLSVGESLLVPAVRVIYHFLQCSLLFLSYSMRCCIVELVPLRSHDALSENCLVLTPVVCLIRPDLAAHWVDSQTFTYSTIGTVHIDEKSIHDPTIRFTDLQHFPLNSVPLSLTALPSYMKISGNEWNCQQLLCVRSKPVDFQLCQLMFEPNQITGGFQSLSLSLSRALNLTALQSASVWVSFHQLIGASEL